MVSAFLNTVKIPELRRRILFTLAVIVIVRLRAGELRDFFPGYYALHQRIDHDAVADRSDSAAWENGARRRRPAEDHAVNALRDGRVVPFPGIPAGIIFSASRIVAYDAAGNHRHEQEPGSSTRR